MWRKDFVLLVVKIAALAVFLMLVNGIGSLFLPAAPGAGAASEGASGTAPPSGSFMALTLIVMLLQTIALAYPTVRSKWHGWRLSIAVFLLYFGTVTFMSQIESLVYLRGKMPDGMLLGIFAMGLFAAAVFAPVAVLALGRWRSGTPATRSSHGVPTSMAEWSWKAATGGLVFLALYYLFGYYVAWQNPALRAYYGGTDPGSFAAQMIGTVQSVPWMLPFQFARGLLWVALAALVLHMMRGHWWEVGLAVSALFALPVLYLLLPNPIMPEEIRMAHLVETLPYQFLFGWFSVWLLSRQGAAKLAPEPA